MHHGGQELLGVGVVLAQLAAAVGMHEAVDAVHPVAVGFLRQALQGLGRAVDTADGVDNPHLVADADLAVLPAVAHEGGFPVQGQLAGYRLVGVVQHAGQVGFDVMGVHPHPRVDGRRGVADGEGVLDDVGPFGDLAQGELVARGNILRQGHAQAGLSLFQGLQGDAHVVFLIDADKSGHPFSLRFTAGWAGFCFINYKRKRGFRQSST